MSSSSIHGNHRRARDYERQPRRTCVINGCSRRRGWPAGAVLLLNSACRSRQMLDEIKNWLLYATRAAFPSASTTCGAWREGRPGGEAEKEVWPSRASTGRRHHPRRGYTDHRNLVEGHREGFRRNVPGMEEDDRTGRYLNPIYIMADSGARGSSSRSASSPYARPHGQASRDHRDAITANFREG